MTRAVLGTPVMTVGSKKYPRPVSWPAAGDHRGALGLGVLDELGDPVARLGVDEGTDVDALLGALADGQGGHPLGELDFANSSTTLSWT